jgi:hypothetical protein
MRTTVDLSDDLYRRVKAEAAMRGRKFRELVEEALAGLLASSEHRMPEQQMPPSFHDLMRDCCGIARDTPEDYATNPKYMEGFGGWRREP